MVFDVNHLGKGEAGSICPFGPLLRGLFQVQTRPSLLPLSCGSHIWVEEGSERKGWDPLEKDQSSGAGRWGVFSRAGWAVLPGSQNPA